MPNCQRTTCLRKITIPAVIRDNSAARNERSNAFLPAFFDRGNGSEGADVLVSCFGAVLLQGVVVWRNSCTGDVVSDADVCPSVLCRYLWEHEDRLHFTCMPIDQSGFNPPVHRIISLATYRKNSYSEDVICCYLSS